MTDLLYIVTIMHEKEKEPCIWDYYINDSEAAIERSLTTIGDNAVTYKAVWIDVLKREGNRFIRGEFSTKEFDPSRIIIHNAYPSEISQRGHPTITLTPMLLCECPVSQRVRYNGQYAKVISSTQLDYDCYSEDRVTLDLEPNAIVEKVDFFITTDLRW